MPALDQVCYQGTMLAGDLCLSTQPDEGCGRLADWIATNAFPRTEAFWKDRLRSHFAVIPDVCFTHLNRKFTDVRTRNVLEEGVVKEGGLWSEESVPVDALFYSIVHGDAGDTAVVVDRLAATGILQVGGDRNLTRGLLSVSRFRTPAPAQRGQQ